jgi:putative alpha-1,2-mannosidase
VKHATLADGAVIDFDMSASPNTSRGTAADDFPYSFSNGRPGKR